MTDPGEDVAGREISVASEGKGDAVGVGVKCIDADVEWGRDTIDNRDVGYETAVR